MDLGERLKEEALAYAKLKSFQARVDKTKQRILKALAEAPGTWALSFSGGKDSTALLYICLDAGWRGPVLHFYYPETPPENLEFVRATTQALELDLHVVRVSGAWDVYAACGRFFTDPETLEEKRLTNKMLRDYKKRVDTHVGSQGWVGQFMGMRMQESFKREVMLKRKGFLYQTQDRSTWTCCPLFDWVIRDVWAYIYSRNIPFLSHYKDLPEERSELVWLACPLAWSIGQLSKVKKTQPEYYAELVRRWPELKNLT